MNKHVRLVAASLLLALTSLAAFGAASAASDKDINKAMNPLPPAVQKNLDQDSAGKDGIGNTAGAAPELSPHCRRLRADIDRARNAPPTPLRDSYPEGPGRDGRYVPPASIPGAQGRPSGGVEYSQRARLEEQFERECR